MRVLSAELRGVYMERLILTTRNSALSTQHSELRTRNSPNLRAFWIIFVGFRQALGSRLLLHGLHYVRWQVGGSGV